MPKYCSIPVITTPATAANATNNGLKAVRTDESKLPTAEKADCNALPAWDKASVFIPIN